MINSTIFFNIRLAILPILLAWGSICNAQSNDIDYINYKLKSAAFKNFTLGALLENKRFYVEEYHNTHPLSVVYKTDQLIIYPGFGFNNFKPEFDVREVASNPYLPHLSLFELTLKIDDNYKYVAIKNAWFEYEPRDSHWGLYIPYLYPKMWGTNRTLLGVDSMGDIKYISGFPITNPLSDHFSLNPNTPESYISFLKCKMYAYADSVSFLRQEGELYYYQGYLKQEEGGLAKACEIVLNIDDPDKSVKALQCLKLKEGTTENIRYPLKRKEISHYRGYVLDALMRNIYAYRIYNWDTERRIADDSLSTFSIEERLLPYIDSLLPNYDEFFQDANLIRHDSADYTNYILSNPNAKFFEYYYDNPQRDLERNQNNVIWGFTRERPNLIFFKVRIGKSKTLQRNLQQPANAIFDDYLITSLHWERADVFWEQHSCDKTSSETNTFNTIEEQPINKTTVKFEENRADRSSIELSLQNNVNASNEYYLIALDTKSNKVYFVSGNNIFLSATTFLYFGTHNNVSLGNKNLERELIYLQDRLYSLGVWTPLSEENITHLSKDMITIRAPSMLYGEKKLLAITADRRYLNTVQVQAVD